MKKESASSSGIGFTGLLALMFIGLKLTHYIDWSWWWVLSPLWGSVLLFILLIFACVFGLAIVEIFEFPAKKR